MRRFANLFLIMFLADGGFSLVDELVTLLTPLLPFTTLRNLLALNVIFLCVPVYLALGIDRRLPKRIFLPLIFFIFWSLVSTWLFPALAGIRIYGLIMAASQVAIGMLPLTRFRTGGEPCLTMPPELFTTPRFSRTNTLTFAAVNLFVAPLVLLLCIFTVVDANLAAYTAGFLRLTPAGLTMIERVYTHDKQTIRLAAMIHIGDKEYYDAMAESVTPGRNIVLAEGVSDDTQLMRSSIDYGKVAGFLGLVSQDKLLFKGRVIDEAEFEAPRPALSKTEVQANKGSVDILRSDTDISSFRPPTILFLNAISKQLHDNSTFAKGIMAINSWAEKNITPEMNAIIMDDILHRRNLMVLAHLNKALERYDTVIIPWGALHMKEIEADILRRGFVLQKERERVSIDFRKILR